MIEAGTMDPLKVRTVLVDPLIPHRSAVALRTKSYQTYYCYLLYVTPIPDDDVVLRIQYTVYGNQHVVTQNQ
jgi:hypothetical protein